MTNSEQKLQNFLNLIYKYMISEDIHKESFLEFIRVEILREPLQIDDLIYADTIHLSNLFILEEECSKNYRYTHSTHYTEEEIAQKMLKSLSDIHFIRVFISHLQIEMPKEDRSIYFHNLLYNDVLNKHLQRVFAQSDQFSKNCLQEFFITQDISKFNGSSRSIYDLYYKSCYKHLKGEEKPVLQFKNEKFDISVKTKEGKKILTEDNLSFDFDSISDHLHLLKKIISSRSLAKSVSDSNKKIYLTDTFISEEQFYTSIQRLVFNTMQDSDYRELFKLALNYSDNRSLLYLLDMATNKIQIYQCLGIILTQQDIEGLNLTSKFELFVDYLGIDAFYSSYSNCEFQSSSIFENICYCNKYDFVSVLLNKGLDLNRIPNLNNFLNLSFWKSPLDSIILFKSIKNYILSQPDILYNYFYSVINYDDKKNDNLLTFLKTLDVNIFELKNKDGQSLTHKIFNDLDKKKLPSALDFIFDYKSESEPLEWRYTKDTSGNNFMHLSVYNMGFLNTACLFVKDSSLLELFFERDNALRRPIDYVIQCEPESITILVNLLNIIISEHDSLYIHSKPIIDCYSDLLVEDEDFRLLLGKYSNSCIQKLLLQLNEDFPVLKDYIMYDIYTDEGIKDFEKCIRDTLEDDNKIFSWIPKLKEKTGSRRLRLSDKIKRNLDKLRQTFPNFKDFIDYVDNNVHLNDLGSGYFWIPASLLVSAPGIGKTFFLHCLSKAVGVTYDMISMESVTAGFVLVGSSQQWSGGQPGSIFYKTFNSEYANNILILDEVDKIPKSNYPIDNVFLPLLETHTAKNFKDEYINIPLDISKVIWVATANDIDNISAPIKSRFQVFNIPSPMFDERVILAQAIYSSLLNENKWGKKFEKTLSNEVLMELARDKNSSRDLRKTILEACGRSARRKDNKLILKDLNIINKNKEISLWDKKHD